MSPADQTHFPYAAGTHPGMSGKNNEDRYGVTTFRTRGGKGVPALLAVLCDGVGGNRAGEVAAQLAVDHITKEVSQSTGSEPARILQQAVQNASQEIYQRSQNDPAERGMGSTCAIAWVVGSRLFTATVGDSRIYIMRKNGIRQVSTDHTWVQEAIEHGILQPEQAKGHPNAHVIRRYLGSPTPPKVDFRLKMNSRENDKQSEDNQGLQLQPGDRILLCSDGLSDLVEAPEILNQFRAQKQDDAVQSLINLANERGGHDNITIITIEVPTGRVPAGVPMPRRLGVAGCVGAALGGLLVIGLAVLGLWYFNRLPVLPILNAASPTPTLTATRPTSTPTVTFTPQVSATVTPLRATSTPFPTSTFTATPQQYIIQPGLPTLTPWPTNTRAPSIPPAAP